MIGWIRFKRRRRLRPVRAVLLELVIAGVVGVVSAGAANATTIVGGSAAQRAVLRQIVAALDPTRIPELRIVPVDGGVKLKTNVRAIRPSWTLSSSAAASTSAPPNWACRRCSRWTRARQAGRRATPGTRSRRLQRL